MSELAKLLRLQAPADKEIVTTQLNVAAQISGELFVSSLTEGFSRKRMIVYNATSSGSGEVYFGGAGVTPANGMLIKKDEWLEISIADSLDIYFVAGSGGVEIRVVELA